MWLSTVRVVGRKGLKLQVAPQNGRPETKEEA